MTEKEIIQNLAEALESARSSLQAAEKWAEKLGKKLGMPTSKIEEMAQEIPNLGKSDESGKIIEGIFNGQNMVDAKQNVYPVPANYASKSKLVEGDRLKLSIAENGAFIYKQIELIPRKLIVGHLVLDGSQYQVLVEKKIYNVLYASVTFHKARVGDQITIIVPENENSRFAAIENVIPRNIIEEEF